MIQSVVEKCTENFTKNCSLFSFILYLSYFDGLPSANTNPGDPYDYTSPPQPLKEFRVKIILSFLEKIIL